MGFLAVIVAAACGFAVGAAWYMTFSAAWIRATGMELDDSGKPAQNPGVFPFIVSAICMILVAGMMRHTFTMAGIDGVGKTLIAGLGVGAFFITPWVAMNYAYAMRDPKLAVIDGGYAIVGCGVIGLVLGLF